MNNRWVFILLMPLAVLLFTSCEDEVTYSEMKEREQGYINNYIMYDGVNVIPFTQFVAQGYTTNVDNNEYVLLDNNVYAQFVRNPSDVPGAKKIEDGESCTLLVRYTEYSMQEGTILSATEQEADADEMIVRNESGTYTATLSSGVMVEKYGTSAVPSGWLVVMPYLYFTRSQANLAEVNLIVPHSAGTSLAATYVYPCFYNIKFQPRR